MQAQASEQDRSFPTSVKKYEIDGQKYTVIRHFTGEKEIGRAIREIAVCRVNREMGLS